MAVIRLVEGWTDPLDCTLTVDGEAVDLTSATVELVARRNTNAVIQLSGTSSIVTPPAGLVRFSPASSDILYSVRNYYVRWKVTIAGRVSFFPNDNPDKWVVDP